MKSTILKATLVVIIVATCAFVAVFGMFGDNVCAAGGGMYDIVNDNIIKMYESEISLAPVASDKSQQWLDTMAARLGVCANKLKAALLLSDLAARVGESKSFTEIAAMKDIALLQYAKNLADKYLAAQPEQRRAYLKSLALNALKGKV